MNPFCAVYARCYDFFMDRVDRAGGAQHRRRLVEEVAGEVLEIRPHVIRIAERLAA